MRAQGAAKPDGTTAAQQTVASQPQTVGRQPGAAHPAEQTDSGAAKTVSATVAPAPGNGTSHAGNHAGDRRPGDSSGSGPGSQGQSAAGTTSTTGTAAPNSGQSTFVAASTAPAGAAQGAQAQAHVPAMPTFIRQPVTLGEAIDTIRATFTANRSGLSSARISLAPASLGGLTISLSQTPDGLVARVIAEHPEALASLQQNAGELRQSLQQSGVNLLQLDIGSAGDQSLGGTRDQSQFGGSNGGGNSSSYGAGTEAIDEQLPSVTQATLQLNDGALVDVLA